MSQRRTQYNHSNLYGNNSNEVDITEGNPVYDIRVVQSQREIKQLKEKIELQTELNRQLERDKNELQSQLDSYKNRCSDLQKNLDDKDQHLNEVVASLTMQHSKPVTVQKKKKERSGWFGFGTPKSNSKLTTQTHIQTHTPNPNSNNNFYNSPLNSPSIDIDDDYMQSMDLPLHNNTHRPNIPITMTAPIGSSLPITRPRRHGSVHILGSTDGSADIYIGAGTSSLIGMERTEMEWKIKNSSKDKLRNYIRDLFDQYTALDAEKSQLFHDLVKATHNQGWTEKQAINKDKQAKTAIEKERNAKNHIRMLEKSLNKERKKIDKYRITFEDFKQNAIQKRKQLILSEKRLKDIIGMKDEFIQRACYKLILYKDRLSQFEVPVFQEYLILISPNIKDLMRYDGEGMNGPGSTCQNLSALHEDMVHKQTPGGPGTGTGPGYINEDVNSAGGTVTSIASVNSSVGRRKSSSRKSSVASAADNDNNQINITGDMNDKSDTVKKKKKRHRNKNKNKKMHRVKSYDDRNNYDENMDETKEEINIPITAKSKTKKRKKLKRRVSDNNMNINNKEEKASLNNLSRRIEKKKQKEEKEKKRKEKLKDKLNENEEDYLEMDLDEMVSSSSSSSSEEDEFLLLSDSIEHNNENMILEYALDENGKYISNDVRLRNGISNNLSNYVELKLVKYPGTGELFIVITKFDDKKDAMEIFRSDFAKCLNIEKNQIEEDFSIYFQHITLVFRGDDYEKTRHILINLRIFFEQHCTNIQPELPPPPEQTVTDQMNIFFGGGF